MAAAFQLGGQDIAPGERATVDLPVGTLLNHAPVNITAQVIRGKRPGPCLLVTACLHGDEICVFRSDQILPRYIVQYRDLRGLAQRGHQLALAAVEPVGRRARLDAVHLAHPRHFGEQGLVETADGDQVAGQAAALVKQAQHRRQQHHVAECSEAADQGMGIGHGCSPGRRCPGYL